MGKDVRHGFPNGVVLDNLDSLVFTSHRNKTVEKGQLFQAFHKFTVAAGQTYNISFTTGDKAIRAYPSVVVTSADKVDFKYFEGATATGGTAITPYCQNRADAPISEIVMSGGATVTVAGTQLAQAWLPGAEGVGQSRSGTAGAGGDTYWQLKPNTTYILQFVNGSAASNVIQLNEIWTEGELA